MNHRSLTQFLLIFVMVVVVSLPAKSQNPFQAHIRPTEPLSPEEAIKSFDLPDGFSISLVASEPAIAKPLNMAFDHKGRLWITQSDAYPYQVTNNQFDKYQDAVMILEDVDGDGSADIIRKFADKLNIPIGLYPYRDGVIVWSIPNIWWLRDTDGDDVADERKVLFGSLGETRDTHGMQNGFRRGLDGWLYINHGFNNNSHIRGLDGSEIKIHSGNTYRVSVDGKTVQQFTYGQVNPFGSDFDRFGFLYTADCHSQPIYQLMPGAYYPSFGKPHDGLGFAPQVMQHSHGSTAISGLVVIDDPIWPEEFQQNMMVGNVMTSRINRDTVEFRGSSPKAIEAPDFIKSSDPWFRPVDLRWGPDGALYIADFYNRIIGHYEVPLDHPQRDRSSGRIWRVTYHGKDHLQRWNYPQLNLTSTNMAQAVRELASPNPTRRSIAFDFLVDQHPRQALKRFNDIVSERGSDTDPFSKPLALWGLERLGHLTDARLLGAAADPSELMRVHAFRILSERDELSQSIRRSLVIGLSDPAPRVQRLAALALSRHPHPSHLKPLLQKTIQSMDSQSPDDHLTHRLRMAVRDHIQSMDSFAPLSALPANSRESDLVFQTLLVIQNHTAADFLADNTSPSHSNLDLISHLSRNLKTESLDKIVPFLPVTESENIELALESLKVLNANFKLSGRSLGDLPDGLGKWMESVSSSGLAGFAALPQQPFHFVRDLSNPNREIPWFIQDRASADGNGLSPFISSLPVGGESFTGTLRSRSFTIPANLSFYLAGHRGYPDTSGHTLNYIQLVDSQSGEIIKKSFPPRNDTAQMISWSLDKWAGRSGYLEIHDGDTAGAYAWMAVGRISPDVIKLPKMGPREILNQVNEVYSAIGGSSSPKLVELSRLILGRSDLPGQVRVAAANYLSSSQGVNFMTSLFQEDLGRWKADDAGFHTELIEWLAGRSSPAGLQVVESAFDSASFIEQKVWTHALAQHPSGAKLLAQLITAGKAALAVVDEDSIWNRVRGHIPDARLDEIESRRAALTAHTENLAKETEKKISEVMVLSGSPETGKSHYDMFCKVCHIKGGEGVLIAPQLDGIASRGKSRILEDILNPNQVIDEAFRVRIIELKSGEVHSGLFRREEGNFRIFINPTGEEFSLDKNDIAQEIDSAQSLMPEGFGFVLNNQQLADLLAFLTQDETPDN